VRARGKLRKWVTVVASSAAFFALTPGVAESAFPGQNDKIVFYRAVGGDLWTINPDGSGLTNITNTGSDPFEHAPAWSRDGSKVAYVLDPLGEYDDIWTRNFDGSNPFGVTKPGQKGSCHYPGGPSWSPDGQQILFTCDDGSDSEIYKIGVGGIGLTKLTDNDFIQDGGPVWSPNTSKIAFSRTSPGSVNGIYTMNPDGSGVALLIDGPVGSSSGSLDWSPDGARLVFLSDRDCQTCVEDIYTMNSDGTNVVRVTNSPQNKQNPAWSPDGTKLVFDSCTWDGGNPPNCIPDIYTMNPDGTQVMPLPNASGTSFGEYDPNWRPYLPVLQANLSLTKTDSPDPVVIGQQLTYTLQVVNNGPDEARGVTVVDPISKRLRLRSARTTQGHCRLQTRLVSCQLGDIATFGSVTVTITVRPTRGGVVTNTATVSATSPADPIPGNNSASATTTVQR
jgi:uncharacterized repeat protein (TIGR01451 family)